MKSKLQAMAKAHINNTFQGVSHLFTGCGTGEGIIGMAYIGMICNRMYNKGVLQLRGRSTWLTFAHELGHNFGGQHTFEEEKGKTGGIMDYGDGKKNGVYQFNTKYRKKVMCAKMNQFVNKCKCRFSAAE